MAEDEIPPAADHFRFFAGAARTLEGPTSGEFLADHTLVIRHEPIGVVGQVTPWNYPLMMAVWKIAPALAAGNTVVLKPSDTTPVSTVKLAEIIGEILPAGVFNVVVGDRETGAKVVGHPSASMVAITGSAGAGVQVAQVGGRRFSSGCTEPGRQSAVVVFDDVKDIPAVAEAIAGAALYNAGQGLHRGLPGAGPRASTSPSSRPSPRRPRPPGPAAWTSRRPSTARSTTPSSSPGWKGSWSARPVTPRWSPAGGASGRRGYFFEPTVVDGLQQDDEMIQTEVFGPVITVQTFSDEAEALAKANDVKFGLSASVWTSDHGRAMRMSRRLDFGVVWVNTHIPFVSEMPHGGFKHSATARTCRSSACTTTPG